MICQSCNEKEATVHITKIINGVKNEMHICDECARQNQEYNIMSQGNLGFSLPFQNILDGFFEVMGAPAQTPSVEEKVCPVCNMTFEDFRRTGKFGCSNCYSAFEPKIMPIVRRIHGNIQHTGKVPKRTGGMLKLQRDVEKLKEQLKIAVGNEEYESAAKLRDEIRRIESSMENKDK